MSRPTIEDHTVDHQGDEAAIWGIIADVETGYNTNDAGLLVKHFSQNASVVNVHGLKFEGWNNLYDISVKGVAEPLHDLFVRYEVQDITFLRPDVAIAHKRGIPTNPKGQVIEGEQTMIALYVLVKEDDQWWVASRQNTFEG